MGKRLYCGNLPYSATAEEVKAIFSEEGRKVVDIHIVTDRDTGRPRGFAFVEMETDDEAAAAVRSLDGRLIGGRPLAVKEARDRPPRQGGGGGGGAPPWRAGPPRPPRAPLHRDGFVPARDHDPRPFQDFAPAPAPEPAYQEPADYAPPDDIDYRDRSDRGRRGRDRRGGKRRQQNDFDPGW